MPESPRFLVQRDDHQRALKILIRLHHDPHNPDESFAREELRLIVERCQTEKEIVRIDGTWRLFTKRGNRQRLLLAWLVMVGGQNIGPLVINNYNVLLYSSLGLGATTSLLLSAAYNTVGLVIALIGGLISDRLGRRRALGEYSWLGTARLPKLTVYECSHRIRTGDLCLRNPDRNDSQVQIYSIERLGGCLHNNGFCLRSMASILQALLLKIHC